MNVTSNCPKCGSDSVVAPFRIGRTDHEVCIDCGWCVSHERYFPSAARPKSTSEVRA